MAHTVTNVMAISLDGMIGSHALESDHERRQYNFTNIDDRDYVRSLLEKADAVITGANSLRASSGAWLVRNDRGVNPAWIVLSTAGIQEHHVFWGQTSVRRVLASPSPLQTSMCAISGVENWLIDSNHLAQLLSRLADEGLLRILLFGGGAINKLFYEQGLVDFAKITICPLVLGGVASPRFVNTGLPNPVHFEAISSVLKGDLVFLTYRVKKN